MIYFDDERRHLSLGTPPRFVDNYHSVSLWTLLHTAVVSSVD